MFSFLTRLAVRKSSVTLLLVVGILLFGGFATTQLQQELLPSVDFPVVTVLTSYPGAEPQTVADTVSAQVEQAVSDLPGLQTVQSTSINGESIVLATFDFGTDMKATQQTISSNLQGIALPSGASLPQVETFNLQSQPILQLSLSSNTETPAQLAQIARTQIIPALKTVAGVSNIDLLGGGSRQLLITLDPAKLAAKGISVQQIVALLQQNSLTVPGGTVDSQGFSVPVVTNHQFQSVQDLCGLVVGGSAAGKSVKGSATGTNPTALCQPIAHQSGLVLLEDVAAVQQSDNTTDGISRTNGIPSIGINITKAQNANTVTVATAVNSKLDDLKAKLPKGVNIVTLQDQSTFITQSINGLVREGLLGAGFAVLVIFFFLLNIRSTLVTAISIPCSLLVAFIILYAANISLNVLTLGGLAIAIGRVVDDAIVVLENIYRHVQAGESVRRAAITATREVGTAITSSTATTLAVFLPLAFIGGIVGEFFRPFALAVVAALAASLLVALTIIPALAKYFVRPSRTASQALRRGQTLEEETTWLQRIYTPVLRWTLSHRAITLIVAIVLFAASVASVSRIPTSFLNQGSQKIISITVSPPAGSDLQAVSDEASKVETILHQDSRVSRYQTTIGGGGSLNALRSVVLGGGSSNSASILVILQNTADLEATTTELRDKISAPDIAGKFFITVQTFSASNSQFQVTLSSDDQQALVSAAQQVFSVVQKEADTANPTSDASAVAPTLSITVDPSRAALYGLTTAQVGQQIRADLAGQTAIQISTSDFNNGQPTNVVVQMDTADLATPQGVNNLPIFYGAGGRSGVVPLGQIATVSIQQSQVKVTRIGGQPAVTISADITSQNTGTVSTDLQQKIDALHLPASVTVSYGGITSQLTTGFSGLLLAMLAAIILVYVLMVITFGSLLDPFILLFSLPLAAIGAFPALLVTGRTISISSLIGLLMLVGIVVTNAIVFLDMVKQREKHGLSTREALLEGGRIRVRPILMTAIATILATAPLALGSNDGSVISAELGTVVIGGLLSSTLLTLVVIPVLYSLASGMKRRLGFRPPHLEVEEEDTAALPVIVAAPTGEEPETEAAGTR
ncbi:MAG TPA: efflux RND transporter permease subunit [Ktedonobacterales bacterium]|jgi:HAE1 family hydrophobic/amphiphilic exporter-1